MSNNDQQLENVALKIAHDVETMIRNYFETKVDDKTPLEIFAFGVLSACLPVALAAGIPREFIVEHMNKMYAGLQASGLVGVS